MDFSRRDTMKFAAAAGAATLFAPNVARAAVPKLVVVGGGTGGATVAKTVAAAAQGAVDVTLVERNPVYMTCYFSNLYLGDHWDFDKLAHNYEAMKANHGVKMAMGNAVNVGDGKVTMADGTEIPYDRAVVAPGIDFKYDLYDGFDEEIASTLVPHAYKSGNQLLLLKQQIAAMEDGGTVVIATPPNPYRCPPGPYERASMIANWLSKHKPASKVLVLDPKTKHSKQALFSEAWETLYPGMVEWVSGDFTGGNFTAVDAKARSVTTADGDVFEADVLNFIPAQKAGQIAIDSGLTGDGDWAAVNPATLESTFVPGVHVLGDACANGAMPKSGFSANSQAKACAQAVLAAMTDKKAFPPRFRNTCWSLVGDDYGIKVGASYKAGDEKIEKVDGFISQVGEDDATHAATAAEGFGWYEAMTSEIFG